MRIFVINCGSSSLKFEYFVKDDGRLASILSGQYSSLSHSPEPDSAKCKYKIGSEKKERPAGALDHGKAFDDLLKLLSEESIDLPDLVGHRVVHGGEEFSETVWINSDVKDSIQELAKYAPLHNPVNLKGIELAEKAFKDAKQAAVFDTAFHATLPPVAYRYAVPAEWYDKYGVRRYGFHGSSHAYVSQKAVEYLELPLAKAAIVSCHLGNGASLAAVAEGKSIDTSMGFGPLAGIVMGSRSGDIDPTLVHYMAGQDGFDLDGVFRDLNKKSGLLGLSQKTRDMRELVEAYDKDESCRLAVDVFIYSLQKRIGAYMAVLSQHFTGDDGIKPVIVFTGGIGENASFIREKVCDGLKLLGARLDKAKNVDRFDGDIVTLNRPDSTISILRIKTDEERYIAEQVAALE